MLSIIQHFTRKNHSGFRLILILISILSIGIQSCKKPNPEKTKNKTIFVSILPQKYIVEQIAGKAFKVEALLPPGTNPAIFEPTPGQMQKLSNAKAYIRIGYIGFEKAWMNKIQATNKQMPVFDQSKGVNLMKSNHKHGSQNHQIIDPHIWLSPAAMHVQIKNITKYLSKINPDSANYFRQNKAKLGRQIVRIDKKIMKMLDSTKRRSILIYHPSLSYFCRDYHLKQLPIEKEGKTPSGQYMAQLIDKSRRLNIRTVFVQKQFPRSKAKAIAREIDAKIETINPLAYNWNEHMVNMAKKIQKALNE